jgi:hypothetical protein
MQDMIENIRAEFKVILNNLDWMDEPSKKAAQEKVFSKIFFFNKKKELGKN